jgi:Protein of unknown function (DUF4199)
MRYALVYGGLAGAIAITIIVATLALDLAGHSLWFGYLVMLAALSLIFVGVKRYRDLECGGVIRFGRAFGLGLGIAIVAGLVYVIGWELYTALSGWNFMADYSASMLEQMHAEGASPAAIQAKQAELREMAEMYANPLFRVPMIFAEIFPVGLIVALVSAALLRNPRLLPARQSS